MTRHSQMEFLKGPQEEHSPAEVLRRSQARDDVRQDLAFLLEFNSDLEKNAHLSRLNERYLELKMKEIDEHIPICSIVYERTRVRLHELLLVCAANYANNCEYAAMGDLMINPRLTVVHVTGCHQPIIKERHTPLTEQFQSRAGRISDVRLWLKSKTALEIKKKPLIPHSYDILAEASSVPMAYLDSAQDRAVQIAEVGAFLCCQGFKDRLELEDWFHRAGTSDRELVKSRMIPLDWHLFKELGHTIRVAAGRQLNQFVLNSAPPHPNPLLQLFGTGLG